MAWAIVQDKDGGFRILVTRGEASYLSREVHRSEDEARRDYSTFHFGYLESVSEVDFALDFDVENPITLKVATHYGRKENHHSG